MKIIPAILTGNLKEFDDLMNGIRLDDKYDRVQIDFIDGEYTNNKSLRVEELESVSKYPQIKFDAHLMVIEKNLQEYIKKLEGFNRVIVQMESVARPEAYKCLALDIHSPIEAVKPYLQNLKYLNLMAIEPGFGGQELDLRIFERVSYLRNLGNFTIAVDGGVEKEHLQKLEDLGVDEVVVGAKRLLSW